MPRNGTNSAVNEMCGLTFGRLQELSDEQLMTHLQNGCDDALAVLFDRYHRLVFTIAARVVRDAGEAEDVMQTVFLDIYRAKGQFDASKGSAKVWLLQYAYHRSLNRRQQLSRRNFYNQGSIQEFGPADRLPATSGCSALPSQESAVLVREALATLNKAQKTALELAYFDGLTMQEIAEKTGETLANVRHHFYRGLDKLRSCLGIESKRARAGQEEISRVES
jgi:RNA polymerase sigma-70 factor (ECF subfamily)